MVSNYLLVATDSQSANGATVASSEIARFRLNCGEWPLYEGTRNRRGMAANDRLLIYCGGAQRGGRQVIAAATVGELKSPGRQHVEESERFLSSTPYLLVKLSQITMLPVPVEIRKVLRQLDCCPKNLSKWGVILHGGVKKLTDHDFDLIFSLGHSPGSTSERA